MSIVRFVIYIVAYGAAALLIGGGILLLFFGDVLNISNARSDGGWLIALGVILFIIDIVATIYLSQQSEG